jgi:mannosyltransferase OCH1-like enzyme
MPDVFEQWWKEFQDLHPDYEFITFTDDNLESLGVKIPSSLKECYKTVGTYAGRSDILRIVLLKQFGGIYVDTDVMPIKSFNDLVENIKKPFIAKRSSKSFESAIIASPQNHPALDILIDKLPQWFLDHKDRSASVQTGPAFISEFWFGRKDIEHLPTKTFYPFNGFMAPKREEKEKIFSDKKKFPPLMYAAHFSNHQWGGKPKS